MFATLLHLWFFSANPPHFQNQIVMFLDSQKSFSHLPEVRTQLCWENLSPPGILWWGYEIQWDKGFLLQPRSGSHHGSCHCAWCLLFVRGKPLSCSISIDTEPLERFFRARNISVKAPCFFWNDDQQISQLFCNYFLQIEKFPSRMQREAYKTQKANEPSKPREGHPLRLYR